MTVSNCYETMQENETSSELNTIDRTQTTIYLHNFTICVPVASKLAGNGLLYPTIKFVHITEKSDRRTKQRSSMS
jgi:hypothetical protein